MKNRTIKVDYLARVEGEGGILVKIKDDRVTEVALNIFEPPRFFEAFLHGRMCTEVPDITARICGICPVAYQTSSCNAIETALGTKVDGQLRALRRLLYCGEWIESHALHIYMLHGPDFLGYQDALQMAADHPEEVTRGLTLKKIGNDIMTAVGGREIHPINVKVGGFYKAPAKKDLLTFVPRLKWAIEASVATIRWVAKLNFPKFEQDYEYVSLRHENEYAIQDGRFVSNKGLDISVQDYEKHFVEEHVPHANALHSVHIGKGAYNVGPTARYCNNYDKLTPLCQKEAKAAGLGTTEFNPFKSIVVRAVELLYACEESLRLIEQYETPEKPCVELKFKAGFGCGASEAPRGTLFHSYKLDDEGKVLTAHIVPPTSQNQKTIEKDLEAYANANVSLPNDKLMWQCEQAVRNYDPCISCATHALRVNITRE